MFTEKEELYLKAKAAYYEGTPFLTDEEFDTLEKELEGIGSSVIEIVGAFTTSTKSKFPHISKMLSLSKIKAISNSEPPKEEVEKWMKKIGYSCYIIEPKFDGNSCNLIYENGALVRALTRGDGEIGIDITHVMKHLVPAYINIHELAEIRGEVLLKKSIFLKKYSQFKNPRNLVAGILHTEELENETIKDFSFVPYEIKVHPKDEPSYYMTNTRQIFQANFFPEISMSTLIDFNSRTFDDIYQSMLEYREKHSEFQLDGFVIKVADTNLRNKLGENSHDPNWAKAIKFQPKEVVATVIGIEWKISKQSNLVPVGILEPVDLDGSMVSRVSLHNYRYVKDNGLFPGAKIILVKSGDIIPMVLKVISVAPEDTKQIPRTCPICGGPITIGEVHATCSNPECTGGNEKKFISAVIAFKMEFFGPSTLEDIYRSGITNPIDIFSLDEQWFSNHGFGTGRSVERLLDQIKKIKTLNLEQVIISLGIDNLGKSIAKQLTNWFQGKKYDFSGLQKSIIEDFVSKGESFKRLQQQIEKLNSLGIEIEKPKEETKMENSITYEMTGSPKPFYDKKETLENDLKEFGYEHTKLDKNCRMLITDDYNSNSSKMVKASKLGIEIITYEDLLKRIKE